MAGHEQAAGHRAYAGVDAFDRRARRRRQLLDAGLDLLGTRGWQATTVTAVCAKASLTARYFYESFQDRDELVIAIFDEVATEVAHRVKTSLGSVSSANDVVRANLGAWVSVVAEDPRKGRVAFVEAMASDALMRHRAESARRLATLIADGVRATSPVGGSAVHQLNVATLMVVGGLIELMTEWLEHRLPCSAEEVADHLARGAMATIAAALPTPATGAGPSTRRAAATPKATNATPLSVDGTP